MKAILQVEQLEDRRTPSASVSLDATGTLTIVADNKGDNIIVQQPNAQTVEVLVNSEHGKTYDFDAATVNNISFQGGEGNDYFANNTGINSFQRAGNGKGVTYLQGGTGNDVIIGGSNAKGSTYITDPAGSNWLYGGAGFNNIFGGRNNDHIFAGPRYNAIYDILGTNDVEGGTGKGYLIVNAQSTTVASEHEAVITFFQSAGANMAAFLQQDVNGNGILDLNPQNQAGVSYTIDQIGDGDDAQLLITYTDANGTQTFTFNKNDVKWIASFGTPGNDTWVNNTDVNDVFYGSAGNDTIIGGFRINVLKGHSGNNVLVARGTYNDLTAGTGTDVLIGSDDGQNVFRTNRTSEVTAISGFRKHDVVLGLPKSINGKVNPNDTDPGISNADYLFWYKFLKERKSI